MNKQLQVIQLSGFEKRNKTGPFSEGTQAFVIAFVYSDDGNFVVKGMAQEVETYIEQRFPNCIYNMTLWRNGKGRSLWGSTRKIYIFHKMVDGRLKYEISIFGPNAEMVRKFSVRRVPHKWLDVYDMAGVNV